MSFLFARAPNETRALAATPTEPGLRAGISSFRGAAAGGSRLAFRLAAAMRAREGRSTFPISGALGFLRAARRVRVLIPRAAD